MCVYLVGGLGVQRASQNATELISALQLRSATSAKDENKALPTLKHTNSTHPRPNPTKAAQEKAGSARTVVADRLPQRFVRRHLGERPAVVRVREAVGSRVILACTPFLRTS